MKYHSYLLLRLFPTCYHRNKNIISTLKLFPPVTIETKTLFLSQTFQLLSPANLVTSKSTGKNPGDGYLNQEMFFQENQLHIYFKNNVADKAIISTCAVNVSGTILIGTLFTCTNYPSIVHANHLKFVSHSNVSAIILLNLPLSSTQASRSWKLGPINNNNNNNKTEHKHYKQHG